MQPQQPLAELINRLWKEGLNKVPRTAAKPSPKQLFLYISGASDALSTAYFASGIRDTDTISGLVQADLGKAVKQPDPRAFLKTVFSRAIEILEE